MIMRWVCKKCDKKWIYPVEKCVYCMGNIEKEIGEQMKVIGTTKVNITCPLHPIAPYHIIMLQDEHGNRMPKKVMREYKMGDVYTRDGSGDESAVSLVKWKYDYYEAVKEALELIKFEVKDCKILIKPDVFAAAYPYQGFTTNPKIVKALIDYLIEKGVKKENITIAEQVQFGEAEKAFVKSGLAKLTKEYEGIKIVDIGKSNFVSKEIEGMKFEISEEVLDKDLIINVPVMKTHLLLGIAGALENMTRVVSAKSYKEMSADMEKAVRGIGLLNKFIGKQVVLGDATIGMQGNGPGQYGEPGFLNLVMASKDPVALDKIFTEIGLLKDAKHVLAAGDMGVGSSDLVDITVVGDELDACRRELKPPIGSRLIKM
ncbi:MAG: DUF362 domain-containing protein [Nanoarchaeota archaeon]